MNGIDYDELKKIILLLESYFNHEEILFNEIKRYYINIDKCYKGINSIEFGEKTMDLSQKLSKIHNMHNDYVEVFENNILKHKDIVEKININFKKLGLGEKNG